MGDEFQDDLVQNTFMNLRAEAKKRGHVLPNLGKGTGQAPTRALSERLSPSPSRSDGDDVEIFPGLVVSESKKKEFRRGPGRPSGPDGRRKPRPLEVPRAGSVLGQEIIKRGWRYELATSWVTTSWENVVGDEVAAHTKVQMVKDGALFISCSSTSWATNLRYMQSFILGRIAESVGAGVITELKIFGPERPNWRKGRLHVKGRGPRDTYG